MKRVLQGANAIGGTALYAFSFSLRTDAAQLAPWAFKIGVASGIAWIGFGGLVLLVNRAQHSILRWADACLGAMSIGMLFLNFATFMNLCRVYLPLQTHLLLLAASDLVMMVTFVLQAAKLRVSWPVSVALWIGGLNGIFFFILGAWR